DLASDSSARCTGHNMGANYVDAHITDDGCGVVQDSNMPIVLDQYTGLASHIPANSCGSYTQEPHNRNDPALPASNLWSGNKTLGATVIMCGDVQLTGNTTITSAAGGSVLVIENG